MFYYLPEIGTCKRYKEVYVGTNEHLLHLTLTLMLLLHILHVENGSAL